MRHSKPIRVVLIVLVLTGLGGGTWWLIRKPAPMPPVLYGNVDVRQLDLAFRVEGRLATVRVEEGDHVAPGQTIATLDPVYLQDAVRVAEGRVATAQANLDKMQTGYRPEEIAQARAQVAQAEAARTLARQTYDRRAGVTLGTAVSRQALDDAKSALNQANATLDHAREALRLTTTGYRSEDIAAAKGQLDAEDGTLDLMRQRLSDAVLTSPSDGTVMTRVREPGAMVAPGTTVISLALTAPMQVRCWVPESLLGRAVPGTRVLIATDSAPGRAYHGQIGFVSPVAEFTPKSVETPELRTSLVYRVRIVVSDPDPRLRQGMPVTLTLQP